MKLATYRVGSGTQVAEVRGSRLIPLTGVTQVDATTPHEVLRAAPREEAAALDLADVVLAPVSSPRRVVCVGLNYAEHVQETQRDVPGYPVLFTKFASSLVGAREEILLPAESTSVDYEGEFVVVIGRAGRRIPAASALEHVLGYSVANDVSMRDFQYKSHQWLQGKAWDASTPVGPWIVTPDEVDITRQTLTTHVNGVEVQSSPTAAMMFDVATLVATVSVFTTLEPGDMILTGTPGGIGIKRQPPLLLGDGDVVRVEVTGVGVVENRVVAEAV